MIELTAEVTNTPEHAEIRIGGYLSSDSVERFDQAMKEVGDAKKVNLSFHEECFINSTGLSALFEHILPSIEQGREYRVVHPAPHFRKVFDIVGLSADVEMFADEASALPLNVRGVPCRHRVGRLYLPRGGRYFGCRHCYGLAYTIRRQVPLAR